MANKMRIQLIKDGLPISDRLVDQKTEFYAGPKEKHEGQIRIEFIIENSADTEGAIGYLKQLTGLVPIEEKVPGKRGRPENVVKEFTGESRQILLQEAIKAGDDQDKFITYLRERDFVFITGEHLMNIIPENYKIKPRHQNGYEWLLRRTKTAKDPRADKFDISFIIGIKILSDRSDKIVIYMNGEFSENLKLEVPKKAFNFKQTNLIKFPHYMTYEEREKWGIEHRQLMANPNKAPSKFYKRWERDVNLGNELKIEHGDKETEKRDRKVTK